MRDLMMKGQLELPAKELFLANFGPEAAKLLSQMFRALWLNYLANEGGISGPYWLEKFANVKTFNNIIRILSDNNWVICVTSSAAKFSSITLNVNKLLSYVSPDELTYIRAKHKYAKYLLTCDLDDSYDDLVRINGAIKVTGLNRPGMAQSAKTQFYYDAEFANPFKDAIIRNVNKGMSKVREMYSTMTFNNADYDAVATEIVEDLLSQPQMFNMGANYLDSRGRAIKAGLAKIANPIGFKDFRAMMTIPADKRNVATLAGLEAIYLFIAELNGYKAGTVSGKLQFGKDCYESRTLPEFNDSTVYEIIWLNRLYNEVENFLIVIEINMLEAHFKEPLTNYYWSVPIELDASASMLQYFGLLLGDKRLLTMTNVIGGTDQLNDPWKFDGIPRTQFKHGSTPLLYGSSRDVTELWRKKKHNYTMDQVKSFNKELDSGALGIANELKRFIVKWCNPQATMNVTIGAESFDIECNRYKHVMDSVVAYTIYDTTSGTYPTIFNVKQVNVPDLEQFRRWFVTGLIHNLDSQVVDSVMSKVMDTYGWGLDIHDACIVCPEAAADVRKWYGEELLAIYEARGTILSNYFKSIGITQTAALDWSKLMDKVEPVGEFTVNPMALK